jgi:hypothetical protein
VDPVERNGLGRFELICELDREGMVAKLRHGSSGVGEVNQLLAGILLRLRCGERDLGGIRAVELYM